jgi:flagellum-specific ATP synthase
VDYHAQVAGILPASISGRVVQLVGATAAVADFPAPVGAVADITRQTGRSIEAEVIGFRDRQTLLYPLTGVDGIRRGSRVILRRTARSLAVGRALLGRVIDAHGQPIDGLPLPALTARLPLDRSPPPPIERPRIDAPLETGVRVIDAMLTCGRGQRLGIFSGSGVGKSVLLGMMARFARADVIVIALVGERGREVKQFVEQELGAAGLARSVVVVATSDAPALVRVHAGLAATSIAEYFRDQGNDVLLVMDSVTRLAMAQREIGLAAGEPPATKGYPPSVFSLLPRLVERTGRAPRGSITAFYSVLVEGDDANEPIADSLRGLLDGHIWLSRGIAARGHFPAVDPLESISRLMVNVVGREHRDDAQLLRSVLAAYRDHEDLISIGAYRKGSSAPVDCAIEMIEPLREMLRQDLSDASTLDEARAQMAALARQIRARMPAGGKEEKTRDLAGSIGRV